MLIRALEADIVARAPGESAAQRGVGAVVEVTDLYAGVAVHRIALGGGVGGFGVAEIVAAHRDRPARERCEGAIEAIEPVVYLELEFTIRLKEHVQCGGDLV